MATATDSPERPSDTEFQEFHIPIHEFVYLTKRELKIVDHPAFQRLFSVNQLGQTNLVYRGATHRRGEHSLGAVAAVQLLIDSLRQPQGRRTSNKWEQDTEISEHEAAFARLAVLLHDIGHVAAGHTLEDELGLLSAHDSVERLNFVFDRREWNNLSIEAEDHLISHTLGELINTEFKPDAKAAGVVRNGEKLEPVDIVLQIIAKDRDEEGLEIESERFRLDILRDLVGNTICADLIDYLHRDWHHIGKQRHFDTRLLQYMEIGELAVSPIPKNRIQQVVINLQSRKPDRYRSDAITEILGLLESRYQLWEIALLHRTKTAASSMLERALMEVFDEFQRKSTEELELFPETEDRNERQLMHDALLEAVIEVSDEALYGTLASDAWLSPLESSMTIPEVSVSLLRRLQHRMLHKEFARADTYTHGLDTGQKQRISAFLAGSKASEENGIAKFYAAVNRLASVHNLEDDFQLPLGSLSMYCVPFGLGQKLADAKILIQDEVWTLRDAGSLRRIDGGHLAAQLERFHGLWRASLFIREDAERMILKDDLRDELRAAFTIGVLGLRSGENSMRKIALSVAQKREFERPGPKRRVRPIPPDLDSNAIDEAALSDPTIAGYPSGSPRIISFLERTS